MLGWCSTRSFRASLSYLKPSMSETILKFPRGPKARYLISHIVLKNLASVAKFQFIFSLVPLMETLPISCLLMNWFSYQQILLESSKRPQGRVYIIDDYRYIMLPPWFYRYSFIFIFSNYRFSLHLRRGLQSFPYILILWKLSQTKTIFLDKPILNSFYEGTPLVTIMIIEKRLIFLMIFEQNYCEDSKMCPSNIVTVFGVFNRFIACNSAYFYWVSIVKSYLSFLCFNVYSIYYRNPL